MCRGVPPGARRPVRREPHAARASGGQVRYLGRVSSPRTPRAKAARISIVPDLASLTKKGLSVDFDEHLTITILFRKPPTAAQRKAVERLATEWERRVEAATKRVCEEDPMDFDRSEIRFSSPAFSGKEAQFGASRFLDADDASVWLATNIAAVSGVELLRFGEDPRAAEAPKPTAKPTKVNAPRSKALSAGVLGLIPKDEAIRTKVMAVFGVRFRGDGTKHLGKTVSEALECYYEHVGAAGPCWLTGSFQPQGQRRFSVTTGRDIATAKGRATLADQLSLFKTLPTTFYEKKKNTKSAYLEAWLKDGERPVHKSGYYTPTARVPEQAAVILLIHAPDSPIIRHGSIEFYFPLAALEDPTARDAWTKTADAVFAILHGSVGFMSPALWGHGDRPSLFEIYRKFSQIETPAMSGGRQGRCIFPADMKPAAVDGMFAPSWQMWLGPALAKKVKRFAGEKKTVPGGVRFTVEQEPPFEMTPQRRALYTEAWRAFAALHISGIPTDEDAFDSEKKFAAAYFARFA